MPANRRGSSLPTQRSVPDDAPAIFVTLGSQSLPLLPDAVYVTGGNPDRSPAEAQVALGNAVFAHLRRMYGPNVHVSVTFGPEPVDECIVVGIRPDPEFAILEAIAAIREAQVRTGSTRTSSVRVVLPDGIVLDAAAEAPAEVSLFESAAGRLALLVDGWAVTGFELLVGWRLVPDVRALLAGETIPTHTRWVHDGAVLVVWTDGRFLFEGTIPPTEAQATGSDDTPQTPATTAPRVVPGSRIVPKADVDPWRTSWDWVASVARDGEMRVAVRLSARSRRILDLPPEPPALADF